MHCGGPRGERRRVPERSAGGLGTGKTSRCARRPPWAVHRHRGGDPGLLSPLDPQPFHTDPEAARTTSSGGLIAAAGTPAPLMMRLSVEVPCAARRRPGRGARIDSCRWRRASAAGGYPDRTHRGARELALPDEAHRLRAAPHRDDEPARRGRPERGGISSTSGARTRGRANLVHFEDVAWATCAGSGATSHARGPSWRSPGSSTPTPSTSTRTRAAEPYGPDRERGGTPRPVHPHGLRPRHPLHRPLGRPPGFDDLRWIKPVRPGDVLSVETTVLDKARSVRAGPTCAPSASRAGCSTRMAKR